MPTTNETTHRFPGALGALKWLRENGFQMGVNLRDRWSSESGATAYVLDERKKTLVVVTDRAAGHEPAVCKKTGMGQYSFRNWTFPFVCPTCRASKKFNTNFLGQTDLVCTGTGTFRRVPK